jgi:serine phosphatase RsbU (regulator of sigma subunit)
VEADLPPVTSPPDRSRDGSAGAPRSEVDHAAVFSAMPTPYLVMTPDLVICDCNEAYLATVGREREEILGRPVFEAFPANPDATDADGNVVSVRSSFELARDTGRSHTMPLQKYDIPDPETGGFVERYWSLISVPVLDEAGRTKLIIQRAEDVTDYVEDRQRREASQRRVEEVEADLYKRAQELRAAQDAEARTARRLADLAGVALRLSTAQTEQEMARAVLGAGARALEADSGALAVLDGGELRLLATELARDGGADAEQRLPLSAELPVAAAARGERVLLADQEQCRAWSGELAASVERTGVHAAAALPLRVAGRLLGALSLAWSSPRDLAADEVALLEAFAVQCAAALDRIATEEAEGRATAALLEMAETLQRSLLTDPPDSDDLEIEVRYLPAAERAQVGGDWYDAFQVDDGGTTIVVGDVAGHDQDAAAIMAQVRNVLRGVAHTLQEPPAAVLAALDRAMRDLQVDALATAVLARVEQSDEHRRRGVRRLQWSNAGHLPPLLVRPAGGAELLRTPPDLLLGLDPSTPRSDHDVVLPAGATVLLYSDGLVERRGADLDDGLEWLRRTVSELAGLPLPGLVDDLLSRLPAEVEDDVVLLALRAHPRADTLPGG